MKTNFLFLWLSLFFISNIYGQTENRLSQQDWYVDADNVGDFHIRRTVNYSYFSSGKIKEVIVDYYNVDGVFDQRNAEMYEYDENESLLLRKTTKRYNPTVNIWVTENWTDYMYDANGCQIRSELTYNVGGFLRVLEFERNANCQITKEIQWTKQPTEDTLSKTQIREITFLPDGISYDEKFSRFDFVSGEEYLWRSQMYRFNSDGLLEESQKFIDLHLINSWSGRKRITTYDQYGNRISQYNYVNNASNSDWQFNYNSIYENKYDQQNHLIKVLSKRQHEEGGVLVTSGDSEMVRNYEYECKDFVIQETSAWVLEGIGSGSRFEYKYEGLNECFDIENTSLELSIYPNPTVGNLTINSPVFQSGNTMISVFDISGKLLLETNEIGRMEKVELDLSHLPNGMYVVQLMNQEHFVQHKVVLTK